MAMRGGGRERQSSPIRPPWARCHGRCACHPPSQAAQGWRGTTPLPLPHPRRPLRRSRTDLAYPPIHRAILQSHPPSVHPGRARAPRPASIRPAIHPRGLQRPLRRGSQGGTTAPAKRTGLPSYEREPLLALIAAADPAFAADRADDDADAADAAVPYGLASMLTMQGTSCTQGGGEEREVQGERDYEGL